MCKVMDTSLTSNVFSNKPQADFCVIFIKREEWVLCLRVGCIPVEMLQIIEHLVLEDATVALRSL